jgi:proline dehydrogenase
VTLLDKTIVRLLPAVPKQVVQLFSARYIAGTTLADAVDTVRDLNRIGQLATVDVLGEEITHEDEARTIARAYRDALEAIERENLESNVSVKPTALGLALSY